MTKLKQLAIGNWKFFFPEGFMHISKLRLAAVLALFILAVSGLLVLSTNLNQTQAQTVKSQTQHTTRWEWTDDGWRKRVEIRGKAEFNEDYSDVTALSEGGSLRIEEDHDGEFRRLDVTRDENGQLVRKYFVNGEARALDANGKKWVAGLLLTAVRQGAIDTDKRVQTILRQRGVDGVLEEIATISGDHARRAYFKSLIRNESLSSNDLQKAIEAASVRLTSDYDKANLLKDSADRFLGHAALSSAFFKVVSTIKSDYEHRQILSALLKQNNLSEPVLAQMLESLETISSDYEKANLLKEGADLFLIRPTLSSPFFKAVSTIKSDYEHRQILSALLKQNRLSESVLTQMLDSLETISSDYEKATFLLEASRMYTGETRLRNAFLKATETIKSEHERGRVLSALLRNKQIG
jgi:hypothetical protein